MDQNIHSHTHVMDEKWMFLLITNRDNEDKLCQHLVERENLSPLPGPPPLQSSISMASSQDCNGELGKSVGCYFETYFDALTLLAISSIHYVSSLNPHISPIKP